MGIKPCRYNDHFGTECFYNRDKVPLYESQVFFVSITWQNRVISRRSGPFSTTGFKSSAGSGKCKCRVLVNGVVEYIRIFFENVLGAVTMMNVKIDDFS